MMKLNETQSLEGSNCTVVRDLMTTDEAVRFLYDQGFTQATSEMLSVRRSQGLEPKFVKLGRAVRYRRTDLESWRRRSLRRSGDTSKGGNK